MSNQESDLIEELGELTLIWNRPINVNTRKGAAIYQDAIIDTALFIAQRLESWPERGPAILAGLRGAKKSVTMLLESLT